MTSPNSDDLFACDSAGAGLPYEPQPVDHAWPGPNPKQAFVENGKPLTGWALQLVPGHFEIVDILYRPCWWHRLWQRILLGWRWTPTKVTRSMPPPVRSA